MIFTGMLALVAVLQFIALIWQIKTTTAVTEKQLRAYVFPSHATRLRTYGVMKLKIIFTNAGKTPALECSQWIAEIFPPGIEAPVFIPPPVPAGAEQSRYVLAPGIDMQVYVNAVEPPEEVHNFIRNNLRALYIYGEIHYTDVFHTKHKTSFRYKSSGPDFDEGVFVACEEGNEAD